MKWYTRLGGAGMRKGKPTVRHTNLCASPPCFAALCRGVFGERAYSPNMKPYLNITTVDLIFTNQTTGKDHSKVCEWM